jgi:TetR/AcrR family acrAB operon transcriptional repressor
MARKTKQEAEETRGNILNTALDIIYDKGYARSTFVDIAKRIKLTKGAVYWHFKNKPDLFLALGRQMEEKIDNSLHDLYSNTSNLSNLKRALYEIVQLTAGDEQLRKYYSIVYYRIEWTEELLTIKQFFDLQNQMMLEWIEETLAYAQTEGKIPEEKKIPILARALLQLFGGLLAYCLDRAEDRNDHYLKIVQIGLDTFFAGMQAKDRPVNEAGCQ